MADNRKKNVNWTIPTTEQGLTAHGDAELAVLMDLRDELQSLNNRLICLSGSILIMRKHLAAIASPEYRRREAAAKRRKAR